MRSAIGLGETLVKTPQGIESSRHFADQSRILASSALNVAQVFDFVRVSRSHGDSFVWRLYFSSVPRRIAKLRPASGVPRFGHTISSQGGNLLTQTDIVVVVLILLQSLTLAAP